VKKKFWLVKRIMAIAIAAAGLSMSGYAAAQQAGAHSSHVTTYTTPSVTVRVHWSTQQEVEQRCGKDAAGCASPANAEKAYAEIWAQRPAGWDDYDAICYLGGVVLRIVDSGSVRTNTAEAQLESTPPRLQTVMR
jgi:hypothetical protein